MKQRNRFYPRPQVVSGPVSAVGQAGGVLLTETIRASGLDTELSAGLRRWRRPAALHDPTKVVLDLAVALALGGDCLADMAVLRTEPGLYGSVASEPTVSRTITALAADIDQQQVNAQGERIGINRPDLQYTIGGQRYYEEWDTATCSRGGPHLERTISNDLAGVVFLHTTSN